MVERWLREKETYGTYLMPESSKLLIMYSGSCTIRPISQMSHLARNRNERTHRSCHFGRICPCHVVVQALPPSHPAGGWITHRNQTLKDLGGAFLDGIVVSTELENGFAIGTAVAHEFLEHIAEWSASQPRR